MITIRSNQMKMGEVGSGVKELKKEKEREMEVPLMNQTFPKSLVTCKPSRLSSSCIFHDKSDPRTLGNCSES